MTDKVWTRTVEKYGSQRKASHATGVPRSTLQRYLKREAAGLPTGTATFEKQSETPGVIIPDGYRVKGTSTLYDADGTPKLQWVKSQIDPDAMAALMKAAAEEFARTIIPSKPYSDPVPVCDADLMTCYVLTDLHMGALSWKPETGADWDLQLAEETLIRYFTKAASITPNAKRGLLLNLGDLLHTDGMVPVTPASGHVLDADSRYQKMVRVAVKSLRIAVDILLSKHEEVHILHCTANHDESASAWLKECFAIFYEDDPRVHVYTDPGVYHAIEWGNVSLFAHHGHKRNVNNIEGVFAAKFREILGRTKYSYAHLGHLHSDEVKETSLMRIERHRTLAAPDAYAANGGWISGRSASAPTYHKKFGEISRVVIPFEMINPQ